MSNVDQLAEARSIEERIAVLERTLGGRGGPPYDPGMEARVAKLEAIIPTLATKEDLVRLQGLFKEDLVRECGAIRTELHKELNAQTWRIIGVLALVVTASVTILKLVP